MTTFERPAPDISKIVDAWRRWVAGAEDALPGRTIADLKIGGTDLLLGTIAADTAALVPAFESWDAWERGKSTPESTLAALADAGFGDVIEALSSDT